MSSTLEDCGDGTFLPYCVIEGSRHHVNPRRSAKQCASHIDNEGGGAGPLDLVVVATFFGIKILLLSAEYTLVSEETKKDKAIAVWWARGKFFFRSTLDKWNLVELMTSFSRTVRGLIEDRHLYNC